VYAEHSNAFRYTVTVTAALVGELTNYTVGANGTQMAFASHQLAKSFGCFKTARVLLLLSPRAPGLAIVERVDGQWLWWKPPPLKLISWLLLCSVSPLVRSCCITCARRATTCRPARPPLPSVPEETISVRCAGWLHTHTLPLTTTTTTTTSYITQARDDLTLIRGWVGGCVGDQ
jgi:hypothetical protein